MLTLSLLRHAKSSWEDSALADFDRPLAPRGVRAASRMGAFIRTRRLIPDIILCSAALRARQTCDLLQEQLRADVPVACERSLYMASPDQMLKRLADVGTDAGHVMLIGHDPGMHRLAVKLTFDGDAAAIERLRRKFPTAALAVIALDGETWSAIGPTSGRLLQFVRPSDLD